VYERFVGLGFSSDFSLYRGSKVDVRFVLNRLPTRRMHQALTTSFNSARLLFPGKEHLAIVSAVTMEQMDDINPVYRAIGTDEEQLEAVAAIVNQPRGSPPFVIFGP
jgi:helicase MOV-10